jgi:hypothetical protein
VTVIDDPVEWRLMPLLDQMELAVVTLQAARADATPGAWYAADEVLHPENHDHVDTANITTNGWDVVTCHGGDTGREDDDRTARGNRAVADRNLIQLTAGNPALLTAIEQTITNARQTVLAAIDELGGLGAHAITQHEHAVVMAQSILSLWFTPSEHLYGRQPQFGINAAFADQR